jgi:hypothetical protein
LPSSAPPDLDWMLFGACSELEVRESDRLFFCGQGQSRLAKQARAICAVCEVQGECLEFALRNPEETEYGVCGGITPGNGGVCPGDLASRALALSKNLSQ